MADPVGGAVPPQGGEADRESPRQAPRRQSAAVPGRRRHRCDPGPRRAQALGRARRRLAGNRVGRTLGRTRRRGRLPRSGGHTDGHATRLRRAGRAVLPRHRLASLRHRDERGTAPAALAQHRAERGRDARGSDRPVRQDRDGPRPCPRVLRRVRTRWRRAARRGARLALAPGSAAFPVALTPLVEYMPRPAEPRGRLQAAPGVGGRAGRRVVAGALRLRRPPGARPGRRAVVRRRGRRHAARAGGRRSHALTRLTPGGTLLPALAVDLGDREEEAHDTGSGEPETGRAIGQHGGEARRPQRRCRRHAGGGPRPPRPPRPRTPTSGRGDRPVAGRVRAGR